MNIGVALPEWLFTKDKRKQPVVLLGVLFVGFVVPLMLTLRYVGDDDVKGSGSGGSLEGGGEAVQQTAAWYYHPPTGLKQQTSVNRVLETFVTSAVLLVRSQCTRCLAARARVVPAPVTPRWPLAAAAASLPATGEARGAQGPERALQHPASSGGAGAPRDLQLGHEEAAAGHRQGEQPPAVWPDSHYLARSDRPA